MAADTAQGPRLPDWAPAWASRLVRMPLPRALWALYEEIARADATGHAAEMAYRFLFALFPFLIFLAALAGFIGAKMGTEDAFGKVMGLLALMFPEPVQQVLESWVSGVLTTQSTPLLTLGVAGALWSAAGGVGTMIKGLNRAYGARETRPFWAVLGLTMITTIVLALLMIGGVIAYTVGELAVSWAVEYLHVDPGVWLWWNLIRGPGVTLGLGLVFTVVYAALPNRRLGLRHTWPGGTFAALAWLVLTFGFGFYVTHLSSFDKTFGSLGAAVMLMLWMYAVSVILLIGGHVNAFLSGYKSSAAPESECAG